MTELLLVNTDILIDVANGDSNAIARKILLLSKNQKDYRFISEFNLSIYP